MKIIKSANILDLDEVAHYEPQCLPSSLVFEFSGLVGWYEGAG